MDTNEDVMSLSCDLFRTGKFTDCCELLQRTVDKFHLKQIITRNEVEFILLRNNLLVCNCLRILSEINMEYVDKMTEFINVSELYLYEKHIPLELRINFVSNALHWYCLKPEDIPDYCYNKIITLVNECLHQVLDENGKSCVNLSSHVGKEEDIVNSLECLADGFLHLEPILVVQCLEISQILLLVFLSRHCFISLLMHFTVQLLNQVKTIISAFKHKKINHITNCFKLGFLKINSFLNIEHINAIIVYGHVSLCVMHILENEHRKALYILSTIDEYLDSNDALLCLIYYLRAFVNFNLEDFDVALYYLSQMTNCLMEPFVKSRCYLLLGRTYSKLGNSNLAIETFEKLKESKFKKIIAYYMSQHYEQNNMQFTQMMVLERAIKGDFDGNNHMHKDIFISYISKVLFILHPQPDLTRKQLLYMAAKKKYEFSSYKLAASAYLNLLKSKECESFVSDLVIIPSNFMLKHEAAIALIKAHEMEEAYQLCQSLIEEFEPRCDMWKSDSFWANELNEYNFNVVGTMLLAESGFNYNTDLVLEMLNKSFNCLYEKMSSDYVTETDVYNENNMKVTLCQILIGKILLLKATFLNRLNKEEDCEVTFKKALKYNAGDEDIVYLYSKWLEHKGKISQSMDVRSQFVRKNLNKLITCDTDIIMTYILENKHDLEDKFISTNVIDDLFADTEEKVMEVDEIMDPADDDIFNDLFLD